MSNNKQSSVEWLEAELKKIPFVKVDEFIYLNKPKQCNKNKHNFMQLLY
jgi:hypothetical protein